MSRRVTLYLVLAFLAAALFVRLGFWQISRLHQRRARNAEITARLAEPPTSPRTVPADTGAAHFRRVRVAGALDYAHEIVLAYRTRNGSPGVQVLTPMHVAGTDTLLYVDRGWVYSPNGADVDLARWREGDSLDAAGWVDVSTPQRGVPRLGSTPRAFRWFDAAAVSREAHAPVAPYYVVLDTLPGDPPKDRPVRVPPPALDEGPHKSYAIQWFCFAALAIVGSIVFVRTQRDEGR